MVVDMEIGPKVSRKWDRPQQLAEPPHDLGACARVGGDDENGLGEDETLPY